MTREHSNYKSCRGCGNLLDQLALDAGCAFCKSVEGANLRIRKVAPVETAPAITLKKLTALLAIALIVVAAFYLRK